MTTEQGTIKKADRTNLAPPTKQQLIHLINTVPNTKHRALFILLYITGCRIAEITGRKKKDKQLHTPIYKHQVEIIEEEGRQTLLIQNVKVLKRRKLIHKTIRLPIEPEKQFLEPLINYINTLQMEEPLFDYHPAYVWELVKKYFGNNYFPHFFRHTRATRLASDYGFNAIELATFLGWGDTRVAMTYTHLSTQDLAKKIK